jgi:hypothetical protein
MMRPKFLESTSRLYVKLLSVLVAALLSLTVTAERPGQTRLTVPVRITHVPAGIRVVSPLPATVEVIVAGPKILLLLLPMHEVSCDLDLAGAVAGQIIFAPKEGSFDLPDKALKVVRVIPGALPLTLAPSDQK